MKKLAILGASGHGKVVADIAELSGWDVIFFDDAYPEKQSIDNFWPVVGNSEDLYKNISTYSGCFVAIGDNKIRMKKLHELEELGVDLPVLIHPKAIVSKYALINTGTVVMANAVINPFASIAKGVIINTSAIVDHDCCLSAGVHVSPGANLAGDVKVGTNTWIGIGATLKQCVQVGSDTIIGAGALVICDIPNSVTAVGLPARVQSDSIGKNKND